MRGKSNRDAPFHGCRSSSCRRLLLSMLTYRAAARNTRVVSRVRRDTLCLQNHKDINARPVATKFSRVTRRHGRLPRRRCGRMTARQADPVGNCGNPSTVGGRPVRAFLNPRRSDSSSVNHPRPLLKIRSGSAIRSPLSPDAVALRVCFELRSRGHPDARATTATGPQYPTAALRATRRGRICSYLKQATAAPPLACACGFACVVSPMLRAERRDSSHAPVHA
jgi:hypothetical protein